MRPGGPIITPPPTAGTVNPPAQATRPVATEPIDGDGQARGCRPGSSFVVKGPGFSRELGEVLPSWVQATPRPGDRGAQPDRAVEGVLVESRISGTDFPLKPWHGDYDWNLYVRPDPEYRELLSVANVKHGRGLLECEWETSAFPSWAWPQQGQRVWLLGRWIYDCGHPEASGYKTEIHPPKAVVSFRSEAFRFTRTEAPVRANHAVVFISGNGGYWRSPINDRDYEFDLQLPPRPSPQAEPIVQVRPRTTPLPVRPVITKKPTKQGGLVTVKIPLKGLRPEPDAYGAIISCGWKNPAGIDASIARVTVSIDKIFMDANLDVLGNDEWYVYAGINGRWKVLKSLSGDTATIRHAVTLDLHPTDQIRLTVCGFEADEVHDLMGHSTSIPARVASERTSRDVSLNAAQTIRNKFLGLMAVNPGILNENFVLSTIFRSLPVPTGPTKQTVRTHSPDKDYRIQYTITR